MGGKANTWQQFVVGGAMPVVKARCLPNRSATRGPWCSSTRIERDPGAPEEEPAQRRVESHRELFTSGLASRLGRARKPPRAARQASGHSEEAEKLLCAKSCESIGARFRNRRESVENSLPTVR